jgi:hypothetical protein
MSVEGDKFAKVRPNFILLVNGRPIGMGEAQWTKTNLTAQLEKSKTGLRYGPGFMIGPKRLPTPSKIVPGFFAPKQAITGANCYSLKHRALP